MDIKYNNILFKDCDWTLNEGKAIIEMIPSTYTMGQLVELFSQNYPIEVYEEDTVIGIWNALQFSAIERKSSGNILITLYVAAAPETTEEQLINGIDGAEECILELAEIYSEIESTQNNVKEFIQQYKSRVEETIKSFDDKADHTDKRFNELISIINIAQDIINKMQDALTAAEAKISAMPQNVNERIGALETAYNRLADRIAELENRLT